MAVSKRIVALLLISVLVLNQLASAAMLPHQLTDNLVSDNGDEDGSEKIDCGGACTARCQSSSRPNLCHRACGTCCARCNCVPPGTFGNYDACPCYANMTTHGNKRKCP